MSDDILDSPWFAARIAEAEERGGARVRERVEAVLRADISGADAVSISGRHGHLRRELRAALADEAAP